jgi:hypothetical protein
MPVRSLAQRAIDLAALVLVLAFLALLCRGIQDIFSL